MTDSLQTAIERVLDGHDLDQDEMRAAVLQIMDGQAEAISIAALLTALRMKGEAVSEIVGAAQAMQQRAVKIATKRTGLLDTCGTGGDSLKTFNISTATALVAAACDVPIAKHGNRSVSSSSGSADVLEALGVRIDISPERVERCLEEIGIGFCFAPLLHGAMKYAAPVRRQLGFRTIFNLLGPLTNPAGAPYQLLGANHPATAEKLARALSRLKRQRAIVVCGAGELDEVSLWGETTVFEVLDDQVTTTQWSAASFGLPTCRVEELQVSSPEESARVILALLSGAPGASRNMVLANTAAALKAAGRTDDLKQGVASAEKAIDSGKAEQILEQLSKASHA